MTTGRVADLPAVLEAFRRSGAQRWGVTLDEFGAAVGRAAAKRFGAAGSDRDAEDEFVASLHAEDLGLACACAAGRPLAWDHFVVTFRPELYRAARAIAGEADSRDLADSLYGDLYGLSEKDGERRSLFRYYHGRAKLSTWLRSVLAQRHVDVVRSRRRLTSLDDPEHPQAEPTTPAPAAGDAGRMAAAAHAVSDAIARLEPPDRLRLAYYYVHGLTLADTGRLLGEHEATASRKLERARQTLRRGIEEALAARGGRVDEIENWAEVARVAWDAALAEALGVEAPASQDGTPPSFKGKRMP